MIVKNGDKKIKKNDIIKNEVKTRKNNNINKDDESDESSVSEKEYSNNKSQKYIIKKTKY